MTWPRSAGLLALLALALGGCGGGSVVPRTTLVIVQQAPTATPSTTAATAPDPAPARKAAGTRMSAGQLTVQVTRPVRLHASPGGPVVGGILPQTQFGSATVLPVVRQRGSWLGVLSTALPNGQIGWVAVSPALVPYRSGYSVAASLHRREVVVRDAGRVVLRFPVAIGSPSTPTPTGRFAVTDKLLTEDPASPYGCCILALNGRQPHTPQGWGGGDRIAIHATDLPGTIGSAASLGCLRAPTADVRRLVHTVPLGTLVTISA
jgi:lipoprotein-anchoring transpeptidase ErfK/SrfK